MQSRRGGYSGGDGRGRQQSSRQGSQQNRSQQSSIADMTTDVSLISEVVPVPDELTEWVSGSKVQSMFLKVKEASGIGYITSSRDAAGRICIMIHSPNESASKIARMLVEINFKEQIKYQSEMKRLHQMQESLFEVQGEVASGQRIEITVQKDLVGIIIGKKGARIQEVQRETGVTDININGETGHVVITGPSAASVQRARDMVDVKEEHIPLSGDQATMLRREYASLNEIKDMSKCMVTRVSYEEDCVVLIGTREAIASAKLLLDTKLEYMSKRKQLYESERDIQQQLSNLNKRPGRGGGGGRGGRGGGMLAQNSRRAPRDQYSDRPSGRDQPVGGRRTGDDSLQKLSNDARKKPTNDTDPASSVRDTASGHVANATGKKLAVAGKKITSQKADSSNTELNTVQGKLAGMALKAAVTPKENDSNGTTTVSSAKATGVKQDTKAGKNKKKKTPAAAANSTGENTANAGTSSNHSSSVPPPPDTNTTETDSSAVVPPAAPPMPKRTKATKKEVPATANPKTTPEPLKKDEAGATANGKQRGKTLRQAIQSKG